MKLVNLLLTLGLIVISVIQLITLNKYKELKFEFENVNNKLAEANKYKEQLSVIDPLYARLFEANMILKSKYFGRTLPQSFVFALPGGNILKAEDLTRNHSPIVIMRFKDLGNCLNCIEVLSAQLDILSKYEAKNNLLIATDGLNPRELSVFKSIHQINFEVCSIENGFSIVDKEEEEKFLPLYYIVVDSSNKIIDSFIPLNDSNDEYTSKFLNRHL